MTVDLAKMRQRYEQLQKKQANVGAPYWKPKDGNNLIRLLPPKGVEDSFFLESYYHYNIEENTALACPKKIENKSCPICEAVDQLFRTKRSEDKELAFKWRAKQRFFYNILDLSDPVNKDKPQVYVSGTMVYEQILAYFADPDWGDLSDPETGHDIVIERIGEKIETKYMVKVKPKPRAIDKSILDRMTNLNTGVTLLSYEELKAKLQGDPSPTSEKKESEKPVAKAVEKTESVPAKSSKLPVADDTDGQEDVGKNGGESAPSSDASVEEALAELRKRKAAKKV